MALTFAPVLVEIENLYADVDISGGFSQGKTFANFHQSGKMPPP
jgi:inosine-uridine nucleoside N-ribohydrolase